MNNIIIKSKKTKTLNVHRYLEVESKFDSYYANVYCIMASKRTSHLSKNELKYELAKLYDARFFVTQTIENNIINIRYTLTSILDQFLPIEIAADVEKLFEDGSSIYDFSDQEIESAYRELSLYIKGYLDNKQNIASSKLGDIIDTTGMRLSIEEVEEFYNKPDIEATRSWVNRLKDAEQSRLDFNNGDEVLEQQFTNLNFKFKQYKQAEELTIDKQLDQTYISIGYQLPSTDVTINNLINMIFGGGVYSKLFKVVREKHSLSYNIRSTLASENLITVSGGINNEKVELAINAIDEQMQALIDGQFETELELAKTNYLESLKRGKTNEMSYISMYTSNYLKHDTRTHEQIAEEIQNVTEQQIIEVLKNTVKLSTVYVK
ncbi:insulinase family protein [Mollicutes bacterium LVI A0078]|nr:insulinase family protein [Mollicutes bacterium LVI A0075]WOO90963.1 insulinase family protein [Mollicutes bacterium LVI A0078]